MEIPFDTITETEFVDAAPGSSLASFFLTQPPIFYLEDIATPPTGGPPVRTWKRCADWTEGMQATKILRHDLVGSAAQLEYVLGKFPAAPSSDIRLRYVQPELHSSGLSSEQQNPVSLPTNLSLGLTSESPHSYRPPFGGGAIDGVVRDNLVTDVPKRYPFAEVPLSLSAPPETTTYGDPLSHSHLTLANSSSSSTSAAYPPYSSSSSNFPNMSLYPIDVPVQRSPSHLGGYAQVSGTGQSPYVGQGHGYHMPMPPASAPPSHSHFELAPTPPPPSLVPQLYQRHRMQGQPSLSVTLPFGTGFDSSGQSE
jgi:hypothetical protein